MAEQNIKMNVKTDTGYDTLYPQTKADIVSFNQSAMSEKNVRDALIKIHDLSIEGARNLKSDNDLLNINTIINGYDVNYNKPSHFGTEDASTLKNSPITSGAFYGYRYVLISNEKNEIGGNGHLITVVLIEQYPVSGRMWSMTWDRNKKNWIQNTWTNHDIDSRKYGTISAVLSNNDAGHLVDALVIKELFNWHNNLSIEGARIKDLPNNNLLLIDTAPNKNYEEYNQPCHFGSEDGGSIIASPLAGTPFYGYRYVLISGDGHLRTVVLIEQYPVSGRIWSNTWDRNTNRWYGWRNNLLDNHPIGSIYMTLDDTTTPASLFGGKWERIKDRFLIGIGNTIAGKGQTGGEFNHTLTINEMPSHGHTIQNNASGNEVGYYGSDASGGDKWGVYTSATDSSYVGKLIASNNGGNSPHNNLPPFLAVFMYKRIA